LVTLAAGCDTSSPDGGDDDDDDLRWLENQQDDTSDCGGFEFAEQEKSVGDYCDDELIDWTYDAASGEFWIQDSRILLNCCGDHSMQVAVPNPDELYVLEIDNSIGGSRCGCVCIYDYAVAAQNVPDTPTTLTIERSVDDCAACSGILWSGPIDLTVGSGSIVLQTLLSGTNDSVAEECEAQLGG